MSEYEALRPGLASGSKISTRDTLELAFTHAENVHRDSCRAKRRQISLRDRNQILYNAQGNNGFLCRVQGA